MPTCNGDIVPASVDCNSNKASDQEPGASSSAAPRCNHGDPIPADGVFDGSKPQRYIGIYDGDDDLDSDYEASFLPHGFEVVVVLLVAVRVVVVAVVDAARDGVAAVAPGSRAA